MKRLFSLLIAVLMAATAHAGKESGGGDPVEVDFIGAFNAAVDRYQDGETNDLFNFVGPDLLGIEERAKILVVNDPLFVTKNGRDEEVTARNTPDTLTIEVNRARWNATQDERLKEATALHEFLSLLKIESTGRYPISGGHKTFKLKDAATAATPHATGGRGGTYVNQELGSIVSFKLTKRGKNQFLFEASQHFKLDGSSEGTWLQINAEALPNETEGEYRLAHGSIQAKYGANVCRFPFYGKISFDGDEVFLTSVGPSSFPSEVMNARCPSEASLQYKTKIWPKPFVRKSGGIQ